MPRTTPDHTRPATVFPYADDDAQGNPRIATYPLTIVPREFRGQSFATLLDAMLWSVGA